MLSILHLTEGFRPELEIYAPRGTSEHLQEVREIHTPGQSG